MSRTRSFKQVLAAPFMAAVMSIAMVAVAAPAAVAAPTPAVAVQAAAPAPDPGQMTAAEWKDVKRNLAKSGASRAVAVSGGTRTLTYTLESGTVLQLQEPVGRQAAGDVTTQVSAGGCGFLRLCVYFTPLEQRMIYGELGPLSARRSAPPRARSAAPWRPSWSAPRSCSSASEACALNRLRIQFAPWVGGARCV